MNLFPHALMREMGYFIFFKHSELQCAFGDFKALWHSGGPGELAFHTRGVWHPAVAMGIRGGMSSLVLVPAQPSPQQLHPPRDPTSPSLLSVCLVPGLWKHVDPMSWVAVGDPPWDGEAGQGPKSVSSWKLCWGWLLMWLLFGSARLTRLHTQPVS